MKTNDEWGTPQWVVDIARRVMGSIDLDPCSSPAFNETVQAKKFYTRDDDGLSKPWNGNVFLNPPSGKGIPDAFVRKAHAEMAAGNADSVFYVGFNMSHLRVAEDLRGWPIAVLRDRIKFERLDGTPGVAPMRDNFLAFNTGWWSDVETKVKMFMRWFDEMDDLNASVYVPRGSGL